VGGFRHLLLLIALVMAREHQGVGNRQARDALPGGTERVAHRAQQYRHDGRLFGADMPI
jgi:hypothetical protein